MANIRIDGADYDLPQIDTLTLDEATILYEQSGLTLDQIGELPEDSFHAGFLKGMLVIAVARAKPDTKLSEITEHLGQLKIGELGDVFVKDEDDGGPPTGSQPATGGPAGSSGVNGKDASTGSPEPVSPGSTGHPASAPLTRSDRPTSVG